jgi:hypothetical protein
MNINPWMEEQLNNEHRRDLERTAEQERNAQTDNRQTFWRWLKVSR